MRFLNIVQRAKDDESGAVTVDWVVLAAAIVVLGSGVVSVISPGLQSGAGYVASVVSSAYQ